MTDDLNERIKTLEEEKRILYDNFVNERNRAKDLQETNDILRAGIKEKVENLNYLREKISDRIGIESKDKKTIESLQETINGLEYENIELKSRLSERYSHKSLSLHESLVQIFSLMIDQSDSEEMQDCLKVLVEKFSPDYHLGRKFLTLINDEEGRQENLVEYAKVVFNDKLHHLLRNL